MRLAPIDERPVDLLGAERVYLARGGQPVGVEQIFLRFVDRTVRVPGDYLDVPVEPVPQQ